MQGSKVFELPLQIRAFFGFASLGFSGYRVYGLGVSGCFGCLSLAFLEFSGLVGIHERLWSRLFCLGPFYPNLQNLGFDDDALGVSGLGDSLLHLRNMLRSCVRIWSF